MTTIRQAHHNTPASGFELNRLVARLWNLFAAPAATAIDENGTENAPLYGVDSLPKALRDEMHRRAF